MRVSCCRLRALSFLSVGSDDHEMVAVTPSNFPPTRPAADCVHVWTVALDGNVDVPALAAMLSADEHARAARFHFEKDRRQFLITRGVLRSILARYTGVAPHALRFSYGPRGKPAIDAGHGAGDLHFNVSHAGDRALYGVVRGRAVGVDIERLRDDVAFCDIADRFFSPKENSTFRRLPPEERAQAFFKCWTRKEAYIKALGGGLSVPLDHFDVTLRLGDPVLIRPIPRSDAKDECWSLWEVMSGPEYVAAVAVEGAGVRVCQYEWSRSI